MTAVLGTTTLTGCTKIPDFIGAGTPMLFQATTAPTSWTKLITHNDKALRVVSGTAGSGGTGPFVGILTTIDPPATVGGTTLNSSQIGSHTHPISPGANAFRNVPGGNLIAGTGANYPFAPTNLSVSSAGSPGSHQHPITTNSMSFQVNYVDVILATKD